MFKKIFIPSEDSGLTSVALLVARLWFGLAMMFNHGLDKLTDFQTKADKFPDPLHVGSEVSLALAVFAEVLAALLLAVGLFTRAAAAVLVIDMFVAFLMVHKTIMNGGELAFVYLAGYVMLLIAGGGLFSMDALLFSKSERSRIQRS